MSSANLHLARAFAKAHPTEAAAIVETATGDCVHEICAELGEELAARVLSSSAPVSAARTLSSCSADLAASILALFTPQVAARVMRAMPSEKMQMVQDAMPELARNRVARLLSFPVDQVGSWIDPRAPTVRADQTPRHALELIENSPEGAVHYIYVLDEIGHLIGVASMRELMRSSPDSKMSTLMVHNPRRVSSDDSVGALLSNPGWEVSHALPVVDKNDLFLGVVRYSTYRALQREAGRTTAVPNEEATAEALADVFLLGTAAIGRLAGSFLLGKDKGRDEGLR